MSLGEQGASDAAPGAFDTDGDQIRLEVPADPRFARVARVAVSSLAVRLGFDVSLVEDLRIAVDEALVLLLRDLPSSDPTPESAPEATTTVVMTLTARADDVEVELRLEPPPPPHADVDLSDRPNGLDDPLERFSELLPPRVTSSVARADGVVWLGLDR